MCRRAAEVLIGSDVKVCTVIGFPHGSHRTDVKVYESERAMDDGATELDMVCNIGKVLSGDWVYVAEDIRCRGQGGPPGQGDGEGDLRELLSQGRAQGTAVPHLRRSRGGLRQDVDGLRR